MAWLSGTFENTVMFRIAASKNNSQREAGECQRGITRLNIPRFSLETLSMHHAYPRRRHCLPTRSDRGIAC